MAIMCYLLLFLACEKKAFSIQSCFCTEDNLFGVIFKQNNPPGHNLGQGSIGHLRGCISWNRRGLGGK